MIAPTELMALAGVGTGTGVSLVLYGLAPARPRPSSSLPDVKKPPPRVRLGTALLAAFGRVSPRVTAASSDLEIVGRTPAAHAAAVATAAVIGFGVCPALAALAAFAGIQVPFELPLAGCFLLAAVAALTPVISLHRQAASARRRFRQAFAMWLELVALAQAAGMGLESALQSASGISGDESLRRIQLAIERARHAGHTPWEGLRQLGAQLAMPELTELGATLALAGIEGARIRASLTARAFALRQRELADAEAEANATTERLFLPSIVLMFGFLVFVGYPAVITLTHTI